MQTLLEKTHTRLGQNTILSGLDPEQRLVATSLTGKVCVYAGAGTGKTRAITHRIAFGVKIGKYNPSEVLAVTFTRKAAEEMRERLEKLGAESVTASTFHSLALRQLQVFFLKFFNKIPPKITTNKTRFVGMAAKHIGMDNDYISLKGYEDAISWCKLNMITPTEYAYSPKNYISEKSSVFRKYTAQAIERLMVAYDYFLANEKLMDFEDVLLATHGMLISNPQIASEVHKRFKHFVVDEFQDVSPIQWALLKAWMGKSNDLCVVGDPNQTIYSFAGASASYLQEMAKDKTAKLITLNRNYRSTQGIIKLANDIIANASSNQTGDFKLISQGEKGMRAKFVEYDSSEQEATGISNAIKALWNRGYKDTAVLFRVNDQALEVANNLKQLKVPYKIYYTKEEFNNNKNGRVVNAKIPDASVASANTPDAKIADASVENENENMPKVVLASIHAAKGLEWQNTFIIGVQEGLIPFSSAITKKQIEEEKRLLYVGITRAKERLCISYAKSKKTNYSNGRQLRSTQKPSRFLADYKWQIY